MTMLVEELLGGFTMLEVVFVAVLLSSALGTFVSKSSPFSFTSFTTSFTSASTFFSFIFSSSFRLVGSNVFSSILGALGRLGFAELVIELGRACSACSACIRSLDTVVKVVGGVSFLVPWKCFWKF